MKNEFKNTLLQQALNAVETSPHPIPYGFDCGNFSAVTYINASPFEVVGKAHASAFYHDDKKPFKLVGADDTGRLDNKPRATWFDGFNCSHDVGEYRTINMPLAFELSKAYQGNLKKAFEDVSEILEHAFIYKALSIKPPK
jgi:hypothetical protein